MKTLLLIALVFGLVYSLELPPQYAQNVTTFGAALTRNLECRTACNDEAVTLVTAINNSGLQESPTDNESAEQAVKFRYLQLILQWYWTRTGQDIPTSAASWEAIPSAAEPWEVDEENNCQEWSQYATTSPNNYLEFRDALDTCFGAVSFTNGYGDFGNDYNDGIDEFAYEIAYFSYTDSADNTITHYVDPSNVFTWQAWDHNDFVVSTCVSDPPTTWCERKDLSFGTSWLSNCYNECNTETDRQVYDSPGSYEDYADTWVLKYNTAVDCLSDCDIALDVANDEYQRSLVQYWTNKIDNCMNRSSHPDIDDHVFDDGRAQGTGDEYAINSLACELYQAVDQTQAIKYRLHEDFYINRKNCQNFCRFVAGVNNTEEFEERYYEPYNVDYECREACWDALSGPLNQTRIHTEDDWEFDDGSNASILSLTLAIFSAVIIL